MSRHLVVTSDQAHRRIDEYSESKTKERGDECDTSDVEHPGAGDREAERCRAVRSEDAGRRMSWSRILAFGVLPGLVMLMTTAAGFLKWQDSVIRAADAARIDSVSAAKDAAVGLLSYKPETVERELGSARDRLTGTFKESYTQLTRDVVIPAAKQKHVSAVATVPAAASVSATADHAVVLVFIDQTTVVGKDAPTDTASNIRVTLDKIDARWLISGFDPV
jgi:Mce-associated membrane protein